MALWTSCYSALGNWVTRFAPAVPTETDWSQSVVGSWYIAPSQHGLELLILSLVFGLGTTYYGLTAFGHGINRKLLFNFSPVNKHSHLVERTLFTALAMSLTTTLVHKIIRRHVLFMLQPCHMSAMLLLFVMAWPQKSSPIPNVLFNIYLHTFWGTIAALVFPDLRDHYLIGETVNFFAEHMLILILPFYMVHTGRYLVLPASFKVAMFSFALYGLYHSPFIHIVALKSSININYIFVPPPIGFLVEMGPLYRPLLYCVAMANTFLSRYILVETALIVLRKKSSHHIKAK